jgi:hypothetical protein
LPAFSCARYQAGNKMLVYVLLADPGGMNTIKRLISPRANASSLRISSLWCAAGV